MHGEVDSLLQGEDEVFITLLHHLSDLLEEMDREYVIIHHICCEKDYSITLQQMAVFHRPSRLRHLAIRCENFAAGIEIGTPIYNTTNKAADRTRLRVLGI